jgi:signal transduction histidine kinase
MQSRLIEIFYLFFQGILTFQVLLFGILYLITKKKDLLYYTLFLFFAAVYFFINAPYTFFGIPEDTVWNSTWYDYFNTPVIIIENLFYLLFLKSFFEDVTTDKVVNRVLNTSLWLIPVMLFLFAILTVMKADKQLIYYVVKMISVIPAFVVAYVVIKRKPPFAILVANGLLCTIAGTCITVLMIILRNKEVHHLFTDGYPLLFIRLGLLGDMIFYLAAILKKWHMQEKQLAVEKWKSKLAVEEMRNKISGELHDDFGSTLSGISMYSHMIKDQLHAGKYQQAVDAAVVIQRSADEMVGNLNELVWALNPKNDTLLKLIEKLQEYATNMSLPKNMKFYVNVPDHLQLINLPVEYRRNIFLFCKEAINNAVKYSNGSVLQFSIIESERQLEFSVIDNGRGFETNVLTRGNGLENMQKRANEMGAVLKLQSAKGEGSLISLQLKTF